MEKYIPILIIVLPILLIIGYVIGIYNRLVRLKVLVDKSWRDIDVLLKRRFDLIPNLVETVKGYAGHEKSTFVDVTSLRSGYEKATTIKEKAEISKQLDQIATQIKVQVEAYPELKANENFMMLQNELVNTEDKISYARIFYNDTVARYNLAIASFPAVIIANMFKFTAKEGFAVESPQEKENVKVQF